MIARTGYGIRYWHDATRTGNSYADVRIFYNVVKDSAAAALSFDDVPSSEPQPTGIAVSNNVIYRAQDGSTLRIGDPAGWTFSNNAFPNGVPAGSHPSSLSGDPQLASPAAGGSVEGFKPRAGLAADRRRPARGRGLDGQVEVAAPQPVHHRRGGMTP